MHPLPLTDNSLFIDNSSLERFTTCPRSAQYYLCDKRESSSDRSALTFGKIIHEVLEIRYRNLSKPLDQVRSEMHALLALKFESWQPPEDDFRNYGTASSLIDHYLDTYPIEEFSVFSIPNRGPAVEVPFAAPLGEVDVGAEALVRNPDGTTITRFLDKVQIVWTGRIDLIYESQGRLYLMDHKTTSILGPSYFKEFELSHQVYGYVWAMTQLLRRSIYGFTVNALCARKPTKTGKGFELVRQIVPLDQNLLEEWETDTLHIAADFIEGARRGYLPKHTKWCVGKYGECPYRPVCTTPPAQRELMLMSGLYKSVEWSPLK